MTLFAPRCCFLAARNENGLAQQAMDPQVAIDYKSQLKQDLIALRRRSQPDHHGKIIHYPPSPEEMVRSYPDVAAIAYPTPPTPCPIDPRLLQAIRSNLPCRCSHASVRSAPALRRGQSASVLSEAVAIPGFQIFDRPRPAQPRLALQDIDGRAPPARELPRAQSPWTNPNQLGLHSTHPISGEPMHNIARQPTRTAEGLTVSNGGLRTMDEMHRAFGERRWATPRHGAGEATGPSQGSGGGGGDGSGSGALAAAQAQSELTPPGGDARAEQPAAEQPAPLADATDAAEPSGEAPLGHWDPSSRPASSLNADEGHGATVSISNGADSQTSHRASMVHA